MMAANSCVRHGFYTAWLHVLVIFEASMDYNLPPPFRNVLEKVRDVTLKKPP
jgi:hypothetical protein